jgi:NAD(P)-dependent dehydrogenase (short-subunit alcohol dehydrogenase family)
MGTQFELKESVVIVTGAGRGIGRCVAEECARSGARVALVSRSAGELESAALAITAQVPGAQLISIIADISRRKDVAELFDRVRRIWGPVFGVVCAAGILGEVGPFADADLELWEKTVQVNLFGSMYCAHHAIPQMRENGGGRIIFFSGGGQGPQCRRTAYAASKGAIWRLTETLGAELRDENIFVNAIAPGAVNTRFLDEILKAGEAKAGKILYAEALRQKEGGGCSPQLAARLAVWLLSERAGGLRGKVLSARWDNYEEWSDLAELSDTDTYTFKRVIHPDGGTRFPGTET